eukprot:213880_1
MCGPGASVMVKTTSFAWHPILQSILRLGVFLCLTIVILLRCIINENEIDSTVVALTIINQSNHTVKINILEDISLSPPFPIDVVYTFAGEMLTNGHRVRYNGELRYSLRSIYKYTPWVHAIYIVISNNTAFPSWIIKNQTSPQNCAIPLYFVQHSDICAKTENAVGNHNSNSIESRIHHISSLSNHYIYFCDDFFMFRNTSYLWFFNDEGTPRFPAGKMWNYYSDVKKNPILTYPVYSEANQKRLNISYKIPYTYKKKKKLFSEHMPRPSTRLSLLLLETTYPEWFRFVEQHKTRFCSSLSVVSCFEEDLHLIMTAYRVLRYNMVNDTGLQKEIQQLDSELFKLLNGKAFEVDIFDSGYKKNEMHLWGKGPADPKIFYLQKFINKIIENKPHTLCMNDDWSSNIKSQLYAAEMRFFHRFLRQYLGEDISFERKDFIEPSLRDILADLDVVKYNNFGFNLSNGSNITHLTLSHIGQSLEKFAIGLHPDHHILWGQSGLSRLTNSTPRI